MPNTGGPASATQGLPKTAPINSIVQNGTQTFVNTGTNADGSAAWSNDPTAVANAQAAAAAATKAGVSAGVAPGTGSTDTSSIQDPTLQAMTKNLEGLNSTITSDNASNTDQYNQIIAQQQATGAENDAALSSAEAASVAEQQTANQGQTESTAQTVAMLSQYHGVNSALGQFWSDLSTKQAQAIATIQSQYQTAIANADSTSAAAIQSTMLDQIHTNQQQDQQMFTNAMSIFNGMTTVLSNQQQNSIASQQLALSTKSESFQETQQGITNATNNMNTILTSLAGNENNTWGKIDPATQAALSAAGKAAGLDPSVLQTMVNSNAKEAVTNTSYTDPITGATSMISQDKAGHIISSTVVDPGWGANSATGIANIETTYGNTTQSGNKYFTGTVPKQYLQTLINNGYKSLPAAEGTQMNSITDSNNLLQTALQTINASQLMAKNSGELVSDYGNRTVESALQSYDPGNGQTFQSLQTLVNSTIVASMKTALNVSGGIGLNAAFKNVGDFTMDSNTTVAQLDAELGNFQSQLSDGEDAIFGITSSAPTISGATAASAANAGTGSTSGSTYNGFTLPN